MTDPTSDDGAARADGSKILSATGLHKRYGSRTVVHDVNLRVRSGEVVGLLGPNGAGKTTSFYMLTGLVASDGGTVTLNERDLTGLPIHERAVWA